MLLLASVAMLVLIVAASNYFSISSTVVLNRIRSIGMMRALGSPYALLFFSFFHGVTGLSAMCVGSGSYCSGPIRQLDQYHHRILAGFGYAFRVEVFDDHSFHRAFAGFVACCCAIVGPCTIFSHTIVAR